MHETQRIITPEGRLPELQKRFGRAFWLMQGSFLPIVATGITAASQGEKFSEEGKGILAIVLGTQAVVSLLGFGNFARCGWKLIKEEDAALKRKTPLLEQLAPLKEYPIAEDEQAYEGYLQLQSQLQPHLKQLLPIKANLPQPLFPQSASDNRRVAAMVVLVNEFIDPQKRYRPRSDLDRKDALDFLGKNIFARSLTSQHGLPLQLVEKKIIFDIFHLIFQTERAPEVVCALAGGFSRTIQSFSEAERLKQGVSLSREKLNRALQDAVRAQRFSGILADVPLGIHQEAQGLKATEDSRIFVTREEAMDAARKLVALYFRVQPEVRERTKSEIETTESALKRVNSPETDEVGRILALSWNFRREFFDEDNFFRLKESVPEIREGVVRITDIDFSHVDKQACRVGLTYPTLRELEITITATGETVRIPMETFYVERLVKGHFWFLADEFAKKKFSTQGMQLAKV